MSADRPDLANQVWLATARHHVAHPERHGFTGVEIITRVLDDAPDPVRVGPVHTYVYQHAVAQARPSPLDHRYLTVLANRRRRLFVPGDPTHEFRKGPARPRVEDVRAADRWLLAWYETWAGQAD